MTEGVLTGFAAPVALLGMAEKGYLAAHLTAEAAPGHSSMPTSRTAIGSMSWALAQLERHQIPTQIRGLARQMFETLAPEYSGVNRIFLSNLRRFEPLVRGQLQRQSAGRAMLRSATGLTTVHAASRENTMPGRRQPSTSGCCPATAPSRRSPEPMASSATMTYLLPPQRKIGNRHEYRTPNVPPTGASPHHPGGFSRCHRCPGA